MRKFGGFGHGLLLHLRATGRPPHLVCPPAPRCRRLVPAPSPLRVGEEVWRYPPARAPAGGERKVRKQGFLRRIAVKGRDANAPPAGAL